MTGCLSDADAALILDGFFGGGAIDASVPATFYAALSTTIPASDGTGVTEVSGSAYARVMINNTGTNFPATVTRVKHNGTLISWPTATGSWGTPLAVIFYDDPTATAAVNVRGIAVLDDPQPVTTGVTPKVPIGALTITMPGL